MIQVFRPMRANNERRPSIGEGAKLLGVRDSDVVVKDDVVTKDNGVSVVASADGLMKLPDFLRGITFDSQNNVVVSPSPNNVCLFSFENMEYAPFQFHRKIDRLLEVVPKRDPQLGRIVPSEKMNLKEFRTSVKKTQSNWIAVEWKTIAEAINRRDNY